MSEDRIDLCRMINGRNLLVSVYKLYFIFLSLLVWEFVCLVCVYEIFVVWISVCFCILSLLYLYAWFLQSFVVPAAHALVRGHRFHTPALDSVPFGSLEFWLSQQLSPIHCFLRSALLSFAKHPKHLDSCTRTISPARGSMFLDFKPSTFPAVV